MNEFEEVIKEIENNLRQLTTEEQQKFFEIKKYIEQNIAEYGMPAVLAVAYVGASLAQMQAEVDNEGK